MFFKELSQVMTAGTDISLTVHCQNGILTVSVYPKVKGLKDEAQNHLHPAVLTGDAEELDAGFFNAICQPLQKAGSMLVGMKSFEDSLARVESEKKQAQEQKRNVDKHTQARRDRYDKLVSRADTQEKEGKNDDALQSLREARTMADGDNVAKMDVRIDQVKSKCLQTSLFL
jgi:PRTRC genetic system protein E